MIAARTVRSGAAAATASAATAPCCHRHSMHRRHSLLLAPLLLPRLLLAQRASVRERWRERDNQDRRRQSDCCFKVHLIGQSELLSFLKRSGPTKVTSTWFESPTRQLPHPLSHVHGFT